MADVIMIQGTMSGAGKSLITAGLCRVFRQDGLRVAPFKSQNMALNSYITSEGLEMGRAQVMQAEAAGAEPSVRMNPILLKPTSDNGSQVIVNGEVVGTMPAREYFAYKKKLVPVIMEAYQSLAKEYDVIVVEGAGSPAEINLKSFDIVNMGLAKMLDAPVLLVGDIDRGGVFAQLAGTMLLLEEEEKARVKALIINKFRGDPTLLEPRIDMLKAYTDVPVAGIVPYMPLDLEDEDSLAPRLAAGYTMNREQSARYPGAGEMATGELTGGKEASGISFASETADHPLLDIAVIRLPHISNFTDFYALERIPGMNLHYVDSLSTLGEPDLIILPGSKNTMGDLRWLRGCGLESRILQLAAAGTLVMGICGGYQMLGRELTDPDGVEEGGGMRGMGLLPLRTVFDREKRRTQVNGRILELDGIWKPLSGVFFSGYEIHMGTTVKSDASANDFAELCETSAEMDWKPDGCCRGNVCGSYVHGLFDGRETQQALIGMLLERKGMDPAGLHFIDNQTYKEEQYDLLADGLRRSLDMDMIYRILRDGGHV